MYPIIISFEKFSISLAPCWKSYQGSIMTGECENNNYTKLQSAQHYKMTRMNLCYPSSMISIFYTASLSLIKNLC